MSRQGVILNAHVGLLDVAFHYIEFISLIRDLSQLKISLMPCRTQYTGSAALRLPSY